ncbi:MAG TPA: inosine/xanthosine triphosphatase [Thermaerobacter sp.]
MEGSIRESAESGAPRCIAVGSTNPTKVEAVRQVAAAAWPAVQVLGRDVPSGVRAQPLGTAETEAGARQRARRVLEAVPEADLGVGLEGGVDPGGFLLSACCVRDRWGRESVAWSLRMPLPPQVVRAVLDGEELGPLLERLGGVPGIGRGPGAVGLFTRGLVDRTQLWAMAVAGALAPWLTPQWGWFERDPLPGVRRSTPPAGPSGGRCAPTGGRGRSHAGRRSGSTGPR